MSNSCWYEEEIECIDLGDIRLKKRCSNLLSRLFYTTIVQIQNYKQEAAATKIELTRSPELIHLSNVVLYYRFCYLLCLVRRTYPDTLSFRGINKINLAEIQKQFPNGVQGGGGIKNIKGKKQNKKKRKSKRKRRIRRKKHKTRRRRKKSRKHRKSAKIEKI